MERLERFYKIEQLLKDRKAVSFSTLQSSLGVSAATLKRDLEYMKNRFNAPIEYDRERNGYRFGRPRAGPRYELPGLWFNAGEAYALLSMHTLLAELQPGLLEPHVAPLQERLRAILGGEPAWKDIEKRIRIFQPERRSAPAEHFGVVAAAVLRRSRLWIRHYNRKDDRETEREISPPSWTSTWARATASSPATRCSGRACASRPKRRAGWRRKAGTRSSAPASTRPAATCWRCLTRTTASC